MLGSLRSQSIVSFGASERGVVAFQSTLTLIALSAVSVYKAPEVAKKPKVPCLIFTPPISMAPSF